METIDNSYVHPEEASNLDFWAKKWGTSVKELRNAILETGSLETGRLKDYLHRDKWLNHPVSNTAKLLKAGINLIF